VLSKYPPIPVVYRRGTVTPVVAPSATGEFAQPEAGSDYFATEPHYKSLAGRVLASLHAGYCRVLITGDPPASPHILCPALSSAGAGSFEVVVIDCGPELSRDPLLCVRSVSVMTLFVFDGADRLSDGQINVLCESLTRRQGITPKAVLLAYPPFVNRLGGLQPRLFTDGLATHLPFHELGRDEIATFLRRQLSPGEPRTALNVATITTIADLSGGDPAAVNRLSRLVLEFAQATEGEGGEKPARGAQPPIDIVTAGDSLGEPTPQAVVLAEPVSKRPPHHRRAARGAGIGILLCLIAAGFIVPADNVPSLIDSVAQRIAALSPPTSSPTAASVEQPPRVANTPPEPPVAETRLPGALTSPSPPSTVPAALTSSAPPATASPSEAPPTPPANPPLDETPSPAPAAFAEPGPAAREIAALVARGDAFLQARDITSARLFYERAADAGDADAAMRMGGTFDPAFLARAAIPDTRGDQREALSWYRRARDLGDAEADRLLKTFEQH